MKKKCILFIHGIGSNQKETWGDVKKIIAHKKQHTRDESYSEIDFKYFDYTSNKSKSIFKLGKDILKNILQEEDSNNNTLGQIHSISKKLKGHIDRNIIKKYENIEIIAHSMGGLVATRYLLDEIQNKKKLTVSKILYVCTPFIGSSFADMATKIKLNSSETGEMRTNSLFLKELISDMEKLNFNEKINHIYYFGQDDDIIVDYRASVGYDNQITLSGDHSTLLEEPQIEDNFQFLEDFFLEKRYDYLIDKIYSKAILNEDLRFNKKLKRKITYEDTRKRITQNEIEDFCLSSDDQKIYFNMLQLINTHAFSPHRDFIAEKYYVSITQNENMLNKYWEKIRQYNNIKPYLYIGNRGSGKTLLQNIWIKKHFNEMEKNNIFHVRCDVHKIYYLLKNFSIDLNKSLTIDSYLDMQFLYIFLKYRNKKYNNKGNDKNGVASLLMQKIDKLLDKDNTEIVKGSKFDNLASFLDKQSHNIMHNEVNLRPNNRKYSYAIDLMKNIQSNNTTEDIEDLAIDIVNNSRDISNHKKLNIFLGFLDNKGKEKVFGDIKKDLEKYKNRSSHIKKSAILLILDIINEDKFAYKSTTTNLWYKISKHIQEIILSKNYKILKIVDGLDNIVIQDSQLDKDFFHEKVDEINNIINCKNTNNIFYFLTIRPDTFEKLKKRNEQKCNKEGYRFQDEEKTNLNYSTAFHEDSGMELNKIKSKRYEAFELLYPSDKSSLYTLILNYIFRENNIRDKDLLKIGQTRMILRNCLFLSLQVFFEFSRRGLQFNKKICSEYINRRLVETLFLKNKLYISTAENIGLTTEDTYKVFPNIFHTHLDLDNWGGLCRIRILQLLQDNILSKKDIINTLEYIYPSAYINIKINTLLSYNLIITTFDETTKSIKYSTTYKGKYLLDTIEINLDVLYYMSLDTPMPEHFVNPTDDFSKQSYFSIFRKKNDNPVNTGYSQAIIKSVFTFIIFIKYMHNTEISILSNYSTKQDLVRFTLPFNIETLEKNMISLYKNKIKDYNNLNAYFKHIGMYDDDVKLEKDLELFLWRNKKVDNYKT